MLWHFFGERESVKAGIGTSGVQEIKITVKGGYSPEVVVVREGTPVRLNFYRDETASCSEEVIFGEFHIAHHLPADTTTAILFTPDKAGEFNLHLRDEYDERQADRSIIGMLATGRESAERTPD